MDRRKRAAETAASAGESAAEAARRASEKALRQRRLDGHRLERDPETE